MMRLRVRKEGSALGQSYLEVTNDGHALLVESNAVFINDGDAELVVAGVLGGEAEAERKSASGMNHGELTCKEGIEGTLHAELALIIGGVVAKNGNLNIHGIYMMLELRTDISPHGGKMTSLLLP